MEICDKDDEFKARILPRPNGLRFDGLIKPSGRDKDDYRTGLNVRPDQKQKADGGNTMPEGGWVNLKDKFIIYFLIYGVIK